VRLVDAPTDEVSKIVVTVAKVEADVEGSGWATLSAAPLEVDLLSLQGGVFASLGAASLPAGHVNQLRLYLDETAAQHVTLSDGSEAPLKVPSGVESGIKIVGGFDVGACQSGQVTLDFDGRKSLVHAGGGSGPEGEPDEEKGGPAGAGGKGPTAGGGHKSRGAGTGGGGQGAEAGAPTWLLRPVIKLKSVELAGACPEPSGGASGESAGGAGGQPAEGQSSDGEAGAGQAGGGQAGEGAEGEPPGCESVVCAEGEFCLNGLCVGAG
jgi:hypothetical protein